MPLEVPDPNLFVIFGGTGDLARRKLLPALCDLALSGNLGDRTFILGVSSREQTLEGYRDQVSTALRDAGFQGDQVDRLVRERVFVTRLVTTPEGFAAFKKTIEALEVEHDLVAQNRGFYLALPPGAFEPTINGLGEIGLNKSKGFTRVVVEKPFGHDLPTALELNKLLHRWFDESQIYRIDHYLGKDTVQNLLVFRFANSIFESLWSRDRVESVQITVAETLGLGTRAAYYDKSGALRDMVQNHITQLLTLFAMEVPSSFDPDPIRYEKIKVLRSIAPITAQDIVRGQYAAGELHGEKVPSYLDEPNVPAGTKTETFVALKLSINNWRWKGVPFYLRTGKRLKRKLSQIAIRFKDVPVSLFQQTGATPDSPDLLVITLQPDEGFSLHFDVKVPGNNFALKRIPLTFKYKDMFPELPDAYETLLLDVLTGDQTLFVHGDEVEESWKLYDPVLKLSTPVFPYDSGSWGPPQAEDFGIWDEELFAK
jgi:glucose-6-phosphate 1-dehydrogenase